MSGLNHIALICASEESLRFYADLGFSERTRIVRAYDAVVFMDGFGTTLEIFVDPRHPPRASSPENNGLRHICLVPDDFDAAARRFGVEAPKTDFFGKRFFFISDPDGQPVEIHE
ncbi:MAG: VOC family protein [Clostridiales bacterium]|nr:VOC family protein [Clostridiales bacterium]